MTVTTRAPRTHVRAIAALGITVALVAAGCGDDDDATEATPAAIDTETSDSAAAGDAPAATDAPVETEPAGTDAPATTEAAESSESSPSSVAPESSDAPPDAHVAAFCDASFEAEATATIGPDVDFETATPEEIQAATAEFAATLEPQLDAVVAAAPADIAEDVETLVGFVREGLDTGEDTSSDPDYMAADESIDVYVAESCGYETIEVSGVEYAFENLPTTLDAGRTSFAFTNEGEEVHEMVLFRINDDVTESIEELLALPEEEAFSKATFAGVTFSAQGGTDTETIELTPGRYGAVCFLPVGTMDMSELEGEEEPAGPPHFTAGMVAEFTVT
jgi:uncharacterized cupredoxin-like copper-binding protein